MSHHEGENMAEKIRKKRVTFRVDAPQARNVFLAGSFNDWNPALHPLKGDEAGTWQKIVYLAPGIHEYRFVVDGTWMEDCRGVERVPNPMGEFNSVVRI